MSKLLNVYSHMVFENELTKRGLTDENVETFKNDAFIDIIGKGVEDGLSHFFKENHENVLNLEFDDIDKEVERYGTTDVLYGMSKEQAKETYDFIMKNKDKSFTICCAAGMSRSQGVGNFINQIMKGEYTSTTLLPYPNPHVVAMLKRVWYGYE